MLRQNLNILSPLRYPGSKRRLSGYVAEALRLNRCEPRLLVEPFAGSASVALELLSKGIVESIALGELDPLVASFWKVAFNDSDWLIEKIRRTTISMVNWRRFKSRSWSTDRQRALACIFLNRTSFSGILAPSAGPIGGVRQKSPYGLDCRFNRDTVIRRIEQVAALRDRVAFVEQGDWRTTIATVRTLGLPTQDVFFYFDPPFFDKADRLYNYWFEIDDHSGLHDALESLPEPWLLSYDAAPGIRKLYSQNGNGSRHVDLIYSGGRRQARELIITSLSKLPKRTRIWRTVAEWNETRTTRTATRRAL